MLCFDPLACQSGQNLYLKGANMAKRIKTDALSGATTHGPYDARHNRP